jgi:hypothetical protein
MGSRSTALYDFLGVRYLVGSKGIDLDWDKFSLAYDGDPTVNVYRNEAALPRAFVVHQAVAAGSQAEAWDRIHQADFDPAITVVVEGGAPLDLAVDTPATARVVRYGPNGLEVEIDTPGEGYLVLSDPFYPGWRAAVDGSPAELLRANYAFRAVWVPAGSHQVTMTFQPLSWRVGLGLSLATLLCLLVWAGRGWMRWRRASR